MSFSSFFTSQFYRIRLKLSNETIPDAKTKPKKYSNLRAEYNSVRLLDTLKIMSKSFHKRFICDIWAPQLNHSHSNFGLLLYDVLYWIHNYCIISTYQLNPSRMPRAIFKPWAITIHCKYKPSHSFPNTQNTDLCFHNIFYLFWIWKLGFFFPFQSCFSIIPHPIALHSALFDQLSQTFIFPNCQHATKSRFSYEFSWSKNKNKTKSKL